MSEPKRVAFNLPPPERVPPRPKHCPGALLLVDREGHRRYERDSGLRFIQGERTIPEGEKRPCRVHCGLEIRIDERVHRPTDEQGGNIELAPDASLAVERVAFGLCRPCSDLEHRHRAAMRGMVR